MKYSIKEKSPLQYSPQIFSPRLSAVRTLNVLMDCKSHGQVRIPLIISNYVLGTSWVLRMAREIFADLLTGIEPADRFVLSCQSSVTSNLDELIRVQPRILPLEEFSDGTDKGSEYVLFSK